LAVREHGYKIDWENVAWEHGFKDDREMFIQFHHVEQLSQTNIGLRIKVCARTVGVRMKQLGVEVRKIKSHGPRSPRLPGWRKN
jgi:hypothetical protein